MVEDVMVMRKRHGYERLEKASGGCAVGRQACFLLLFYLFSLFVQHLYTQRLACRAASTVRRCSGPYTVV